MQQKVEWVLISDEPTIAPKEWEMLADRLVSATCLDDTRVRATLVQGLPATRRSILWWSLLEKPVLPVPQGSKFQQEAQFLHSQFSVLSEMQQDVKNAMVECLARTSFVLAQADPEVGYSPKMQVFCYKVLSCLLPDSPTPQQILGCCELLVAAMQRLLWVHRLREYYYTGEFGLVIACKRLKQALGIGCELEEVVGRLFLELRVGGLLLARVVDESLLYGLDVLHRLALKALTGIADLEKIDPKEAAKLFKTRLQELAGLYEQVDDNARVNFFESS